MTKEQTLQGMKKELTEAIRRSASEKDKAKRIEFSKKAEKIATVMYKKLGAYEQGAEKAAAIQQEPTDDE